MSTLFSLVGVSCLKSEDGVLGEHKVLFLRQAFGDLETLKMIFTKASYKILTHCILVILPNPKSDLDIGEPFDLMHNYIYNDNQIVLKCFVSKSRQATNKLLML